MRTILRYEDGRPVWSDNVPSSVISRRISGSLVQGGPGPWETRRQVKRATDAAKRAEAHG
jgi:hypothetical protein